MRLQGSNTSLEQRAYNIRRHALRMGEVQGQGYIAQALGIADVLAVSYFDALNYRPEDPEWEGRDRFLLSIGHYAIALYAALIEAGIIPEDEIETYGSDDSRLPMSGMAAYTPGMEITGGSLGQGLPIAVGMCLGLKRSARRASSTICFRMGNSMRGRHGRPPCRRQLQTRQPHRHRRRQQHAGRRPLEGGAEFRAAGPKFEAFGWYVQRVDGNDIPALVDAFGTRAL